VPSYRAVRPPAAISGVICVLAYARTSLTHMAISRNNPFGNGRARKCLVPQFVKTANLSSWKGVKKAASIASVLKITSRMAKEIVFWGALSAAIILEWTNDEPGGKGFSQLRVDVEFQLQIIISDGSISPSLSREHHESITISSDSVLCCRWKYNDG